MASGTTVPPSSNQFDERANGGLDVDWLIHKKDAQLGLKRIKSASEKSTHSATREDNGAPDSVPSVPQTPAPQDDDSVDPFHVPPEQQQPNGGAPSSLPAIKEPPKTVQPAQKPAQQPHTPSSAKVLTPLPPKTFPKKESRRQSWFSSLGSKLSGSDKSPRTNSVSSVSSNKKSPTTSPAREKSNPFDSQLQKQTEESGEEKPVHVGPRRPSVLVAAGTETKLDNHPGFLGALRRLSSGNTATMGKAAGMTGAVCPRKVMNIDHNRQRPNISDFDQNKLRRVAFKVDVEIAGIAAQADEQEEPSKDALQSDAPSSTKDAKLKDRSEGAALKKAPSADDGTPDSATDAQSEAREEKKKVESQVEVEKHAQKTETKSSEKQSDAEAGDKDAQTDQPQPTTRKKEKKKRSEAERKERKEKRRRQAEQNGLIPLELTLDDDSDSSNLNTPEGASTPRKGQPTTDPLRIYKRCCQLRETTALATIKEQINKPSAVLAEAPGTVGSLDLSGAEMTLADIQTLGDWLAVVPVRRLVLDDCNLSDEGVRVILAGLTGCKTQEQTKANRKLPRRGSGKAGLEQMGVIEKLSMKNNSALSAIAWRHIGLFVHLCRSLRGIDLTGIPFPAHANGDLSRTSTASAGMSSSQELPPKSSDPSQLFARALAERLGDRLEELILSGCNLNSYAMSAIIDSVIKCRIKRLGVAHNDLDEQAIGHIVRYVESGLCEGLDMGGNDLNGAGHLITQVLNESNPLFAMSFADCNLGVSDLRSLLSQLSLLKNFKFIDLSRNRALFEDSDDAIALLRRRLPQMKDLKRIHLADVNMTPTQIISLSEIFPDCPALAHVSILDNQPLIECINSTKGEAQEEACAIFVSLMTAVRASKTLIAIEIEVPSHDSSEVVKALSSQVVAYSLRNLEGTPLSAFGVQQDQQERDRLEKQAPDVLLHLVGHMDGYSENADNDEPAPDEDYVIASTGIVRALGVCLDKGASRLTPRNASPSASGTATPRSGHLRPQAVKKPKDVSLELCESARKIRMRLRPAMVKEDQAGNNEAYRRLLMLDQTLERTIKRFEDEYPESRPKGETSLAAAEPRQRVIAPDPSDRIMSPEPETPAASPPAQEDPYSLKLSRTGSNTSMARALAQEEGRMHRFGQSMRREVLKPTGTDDLLHGTSVNDPPEAEHLARLRARLEAMSGEEVRDKVHTFGPDRVVEELGISAHELQALEKEDPEGFDMFRTSQLAAQMNAGMLDRDAGTRQQQVHGGSAHGAVTSPS